MPANSATNPNHARNVRSFVHWAHTTAHFSDFGGHSGEEVEETGVADEAVVGELGDLEGCSQDRVEPGGSALNGRWRGRIEGAVVDDV
jgi:hypothetical protein